MGPSWTAWKLSGAIFEPSWGHFGPILGLSWGNLGAILGGLGPSWNFLGLQSAILGPFEFVLRRSWGCFGAILGRLGPSWGLLGPSWSHFGPSWKSHCWNRIRGTFLSIHLWMSWDSHGAILGLSWGYLGRSWAILELSGATKGRPEAF